MEKMQAIQKCTATPGACYNSIDIPTINDTEVLIKVKAFALCKSDVDVYQWTPLVAAANYPLPFVMGHEFSGEVVKIGKNVQGIAVGDRVAGETHIPCKHCYSCRTGNQHICGNGMKVLGRSVDGCFAEYIKLPEIAVIPLPDCVTYQQGALMEPFATALHALQKAEPSGKTIAILGTGTIGLMAVELAAFYGATKIIALDLSEEKLLEAKKRGATLLIRGDRQDFVSETLAATGGVGVDAVIDFTGNQRVINQAVAALRIAGTLVHVGMVEKPLTFENFMYGVVYKELIVTGIFGRRMFESWEALYRVLDTGRVDMQGYIGAQMPFTGLAEAVARFDSVTGRIVCSME